ncbi:MAG: hypothetical protein ISS87_01165 [Candidatus Pacebacteria bacterium]|nr:hypothetical protein [Candidatus Paceibacterota bacterium]
MTITQVSFGLGTSTWRYWVEPGVGLEIEKIVFGIGAIGEANVISASLNWQWVGSGPITGLKLLNGINVPTEVWFKLRNHWDVGPITIGVWSDGQFHSNSRCRGPTAPVGGPG